MVAGCALYWNYLRAGPGGQGRHEGTFARTVVGTAFLESLEPRYALSALAGFEMHSHLIRYSAEPNAVGGPSGLAQRKFKRHMDSTIFRLAR